MLRGDGVPGLGGTKVQEVDAVQVHVLCVPGKGGLPHPKVQVSCVHTFNLDPVITCHVVQDAPQAIDVPDILVAVCQGAGDVSTVDCITKGSIFPVFTLQLFKVKMLRGLVPVHQTATAHSVDV